MPMPEEIPTNLMPDEPTIESVNLFGPVSAQEIAEHDNRQREEASYIDLVQDAFSTDNAGRNFYDYLNRKAKYEVDPDYDFTKHSKMLLADIPSVWHDKFKGVGSLDEAIDLRDTIMQEMKTNEKLADNGFVGGLARMTSAVVDVDMILPGIGPAKKMTTLARIARGAALGTSAAVVTEAGLATFGETNDWSTLPVAALLGFTVGGVLGGLQPRLGAGLSVKIVDDAEGLERALDEMTVRTGGDGTMPNPVAQGLLVSPIYREALVDAAAAAKKHGGSAFRGLASGASAAVVDAGPVVIRIASLEPDAPRVKSDLVLQPLERGFNWEVLPKADTSNITQADVAKMSADLLAEGIEFIDAGTDQLGRVNGKLVVLDPGAVQKIGAEPDQAFMGAMWKEKKALRKRADAKGLTLREARVDSGESPATPTDTRAVKDTEVQARMEPEPSKTPSTDEPVDSTAAAYRAARTRTDFVDDDVNALRRFEWDGTTPRTDPQPFDPYVLRKQEWRGTPDGIHKAAQDLAENAQDPDAVKAIDGLDHVINDYTGARVFVGDEGTMGERAAALVADLETRKALGEGWPAKFRQALANSPFADDATRLWESGSPTMRALAVSLFEFADAFVVNNRSGAMLNDFIIGHTYKPQAQIYDSVVQAAWKRKGLSPMDLKGKDAYVKDLNRRVLMQANDLNLNRPVRLDDDVADVLAGIRDMSEKFRKEGAGGFGGERAVPGFENLQKKAAYIPMPWHPDRLRAELIRLEGITGSAKAARKKLGNALKRAYMSANPDMSEEVANQVALALIRRQLAKGDVMDTNIQALLKSDDSRDLLVEALVDNGATKEQAEAMLNKLSASDVEKSTVSYGRRRTNIDLAGEYDGVKIIDLVDNDLQGVLYRYSDTMSKRIALSRHGIDSKRKMVAIKDQVKNELGNVSRADKKKVGEFLDYMFEYFEPGTVDKHINPWMRRAKGAVNLSLLSKLGITQSAETSAIISATGMENFIRASKVMTQASLGKHKKALAEDFGFLLGNVAYERGLLRSDFAQDAALDTITSSSRVAQAFDSILARGQHLQSMISGYTKVIEAQLNLGAIAGANKIFRGLKAGKAADLNDMFQSMGVTPESIKSLQKLVDDGVIEFGADGHVAAMNVSRWPNRIREDFGLSSLRLARQMTQRALAGESMQWLHDSSWAIFGHLMNFPLLAMKKQFLRHAGRKDGQLLALTSWGMGTACLAAVISAGTEGREMTPAYLARRAFSLNNAIGWTAPGIDLFAVMTGLEEYAPGGRYAQEVSIPLLSVAERARGIPAAMAGLLPGAEFTASDKRAMQVLPVVGGAMFMGRVWDAARTDIEE